MRLAGAALVGIWLVSLPLVTWTRVPIWQDEARLWREAQRWAPAKVRPVVNLGQLAQVDGNPMARTYYLHALKLIANPERPWFERREGCVIATRNLALAALQRGQFEEASDWGGYPCDFSRP